MELRQLQYLLAIAEEGHFTHAAEKLYLTQPALSQQIRQLEEEVGSALIDRSRRPMRLTPAGETLYHHARRIFQELAEARVALQELEGLQRGSLTVGVAQMVNVYLIPPVVARFAAAYPGITVRVEELPADALEAGLVDGNLQIGVGFVPPGNASVEGEPLFEEELALVVNRDHPLAGRGEIAVADLDGTPMVLLPDAYCTRRLWNRCAAEAGIQPKVIVEMNTVGGILAAVASMNAASVLPVLALQATDSPLVTVRLREPKPIRTVGLLWRRNGYRCAATRAFGDMARSVARDVVMPVD